MGGIYSLLISKKTVQTRLGDIATATYKLPLSDTGGKGAVAIRLNIDDTSFVFLNCHLEDGTAVANAHTRHQQLKTITQGAFKQERGTQYAQYDVARQNARVYFGDLNFKLYPQDKDKAIIAESLASNDFSKCIAFEELYRFGMSDLLLQRMQEGQLLFPPTSTF